MSKLSWLLVLVLTGLALAASGCGDDDDASSEGGEAAATAPAETSAPADELQTSGCRAVEAPEPKTVELKKPTTTLKSSATYVADVVTNCGDFEITLDAKDAPKTGASFRYLADEGFFDGLTFHRIEPGFVIQGGDPNGDGTGGPGYSVVEAPPSDLKYTKGVVAMAKTGAEAPGTSGSQFYVVTGDDVGLPPEYALVGRVTKGLDVVEKIGQIPADSLPAEPVVMEKVTVKVR